MSSAANNTFDIKSTSLDVLALIPRITDVDRLTAELSKRFASNTQASDQCWVLDLETWSGASEEMVTPLLDWLKVQGFRIIALRHPDTRLAALADKQGLLYLPDTPRQPGTKSQPEPAMTNSMVIDRPVRAGQQIYAKGSSLVVLAMVSAGAEVIADGDIHVYAPLRGRALAGARGNTVARIYTNMMEAELVSIAGVYRTIEQTLPTSIRGKATQIFLENERLVMTALGE